MHQRLMSHSSTGVTLARDVSGELANLNACINSTEFLRSWGSFAGLQVLLWGFMQMQISEPFSQQLGLETSLSLCAVVRTSCSKVACSLRDMSYCRWHDVWHLVCPLTGQASASEGREFRLPAQQLDEEQHFPADDSHAGPFKWR